MPEPTADLWLVLPTYNEASNIEAFVASVRKVLPERGRILIVDDSSPDGTGQIADGIASRDGDVEVMHRPEKQGLGPAYIAGFHRALAGGAELLVQMDSDFSHEPAYLPRVLDTARRADVVIGSRYVPGGGITEWGRGRRAISRAGSAYARLLLGVPVSDLTGGFKCFHREVLEAIDLGSVRSRGYAFQVEMTYRAIRAGFHVVEVPITFRERRVGASKMSRAIVAEAVWRVPWLRLSAARVRRGVS